MKIKRKSKYDHSLINNNISLKTGIMCVAIGIVAACTGGEKETDQADGGSASAEAVIEETQTAETNYQEPELSIFDTTHPLNRHLEFDDDYLPTHPQGSDTNERGTFRTACEFTHLNYDDPIMAPGNPDAMHMHLYLGNPITDSSTVTADEISAAMTTACQGGPLNKTSYWIPSVITPVYETTGNPQAYVNDPNRGFVVVNNQLVHQIDADGNPMYRVVMPSSYYDVDIHGNYAEGRNGGATIYYKFNGFGPIPGETTRRPTIELPQGLRMIAGNAMATAGQPQEQVYRWSCHDTGRRLDAAGQVTTAADSGLPYFNFIPNCQLENSDINAEYGLQWVDGEDVEQVIFNVFFPPCWNGADLDSPDHKSHMAYANADMHACNGNVDPSLPCDQVSQWEYSSAYCPGEIVRADGDYVTDPGINPNTGEVYQWQRLPRIQYNVLFPITYLNASPMMDANGQLLRDANGFVILGSGNWFLSSDTYVTYGKQLDPDLAVSAPASPGGYSGHGDWLMAWDPQVVKTWTQHCINEERHCANSELGNGYRMQFDFSAFSTPSDGGIEIIERGHGPEWMPASP